MKAFIFFLAFLIVVSSILITGQDMYFYLAEQIHLKAIAEDCAMSGALSSMDDMSINYDMAVARANEYLEELKTTNAQDIEILEYYYDEGNPSAFGVRLRLNNHKDFFRVNFLYKDSIERSSVYEWVK